MSTLEEMLAHEIGPATDVAPAEHEPPAQREGGGLVYGPTFVRFVVDRFAAVEQLMARMLAKRENLPQEGQRFVASGNTDSSGNATIIIFDTNPGQKFALHRMYVHAEGKTWISPSQTSGEILVRVDGVPWDGGGLASGQSPGQLPAVFTASRLAAVEAQDGERMDVTINVGPTNTQIICRCMGVLSGVYGDDR